MENWRVGKKLFRLPDQELMRLAYVAMTRPGRLLMLAMPETRRIRNCGRFSEELWNYEVLESSS